MRLALLVTLAFAACGGTPNQPPPPLVAHFDADAPPQGASLIVTVDPDARRGTISGRDLGLVFGVAFHLVTDPHVVIDSVETTEALGADAMRLQVAKGSTARIGLTRPGPTSTAADLTHLHELAHFAFHTDAAIDVRPRLERVTVRRLDGSFVPVTVASGKLVIP